MIEDGDPVAVAWDELLESPSYEQIHPVLRAVFADERLRPLYPRVTMGTTARFSVDGDDRSKCELRIALVYEGGYAVASTWSPEPVFQAHLDEAVQLAKAQLP